MSLDIIPRSFWTFPANLTTLFDQDEDWLSMPNSPSGLSVSEDDKHVYIEAAVPGVSPEQVEVTFKKGVVWISAKGEDKKEDRKYYREASSSYEYRVAVPGEIDQKSEPEAKIKNGILNLILNKAAKEQPKKIVVKSE
jgi:HSP20 family protein